MRVKGALALLILVVMALLLCSCGFLEHKVTLCYAGGETEITAISGIPISFEPEVPEGYIFSGWYSDEEHKHPVDLSLGVTKDTVLYAKYEVDYDAFSRNISSISSAFVSVTCRNYAYDSSGTKPHAVSSASGSGVILESAGGYYYFVTNHHVVAGDLALLCKYTVRDVYGNEYEAELVNSDSSADLALLCFKAGKNELGSLEIDTDIPDYDEAVAAIGNPLGKNNTLTFGKIKNYKEVDITAAGSDTVEVDFKVLWHTAYMESGSSGGALVNAEMELVGINFATGDNSNGDFAYGFAIPADILRLFLSNSR